MDAKELPEDCYEVIDGLRVISPAKVLARIVSDAQEKERLRNRALCAERQYNDAVDRAEKVEAELASVKAQRDSLVGAMLEAERDFHGKKILFSARYLQALDAAARAARQKEGA